MIIGTLMALETCLILGQVSLNLLHWKKKSSRRTHVVRVGDWRENSWHPGKNCGENRKECQTEREELWENLCVCWKSVNPLDCVWKNLYRIIMRTTLQEKETIHCNKIIWYTYLFLCLSHEDSRSKRHEWKKNGRNLEKIPAWDLTKVKSKKEVIDEAKTKGEVQVAPLMDICHLKNTEFETKFKNAKVELYSEATLRDHQHHKRLPGSARQTVDVHWTRIFSITNDSSKSHGYHIQAAGLRRTSSWRSIGQYPSKDGRCSQIVENSQIGMSRHLDLSATTQIASIMVQYGRPSRSSWAESVWSSFDRTIMGKTIWENPIETWLGENSKLGMSFCTPSERVILICVCRWHQVDWKETKHWSDVEST